MFARVARSNACTHSSGASIYLLKGVRYKSLSAVGLKKGRKVKEPASAPEDGQLPPLEEWKDKFYYHGVAKKPTLHSLATARQLVKGFGIADTTTPKIVLEAFAGPGTLSRALCELPPSKLSKLIILEDNPLYLPYLESLAKIDKRVVVRPYNAWFWDSYTKITEEGLFNDVQIQEWDNSRQQAHPPHPQLHFIASTLPLGDAGETLFNQMFRAVATREWLFKYGAMPFSAVMPHTFWKRAVAAPGDKWRCKLSVMVDATTEAKPALDLNKLIVWAKHFYPPQHKHDDYMVAANFNPLGYQALRVSGVEEWDYVLRALFINKTKPISQTLKNMAPGAQNLVKYMDPQKAHLLDRSAIHLTAADWAVVMQAFLDWPFHPSGDELHESIKTNDKRI
ncbi:hypothetical protein M408DRAFT_327118 [Serendipita vermifera MAFF 305830]|uniref:rRNA adenine N(6)-methyltransferase n=1 Tax=Serendipita vermifera MAFF 305830 TaxID=933852 RepID=A0A0C3B4A7_SERVB|nr:hypothetical protein M408DRAFT_327118 [Serendipita vermifera MAFF 305830]